jgi:hypothetical protein
LLGHGRRIPAPSGASIGSPTFRKSGRPRSGPIDDLAKRIEAKGGRLDQGPKDQPWGVRDISLTDPDGFKITIARSQ